MSGKKQGHQRSPKAKCYDFHNVNFAIVFSAKTSVPEKIGTIQMPLFFARQGASNDISYDFETSNWHQVNNLTSSKGHALTQIGRVAYQAICIEQTNTLDVVFSIIIHSKVIAEKRRWWPQVTSDDLGITFQTLQVICFGGISPPGTCNTMILSILKS